MLRIGICDDDKEYREKIYDLIIPSILSYDDADVEFYDTGQQVVESIENGNFNRDLLFLDINMPDRDGLDTAKFIRENNVDVDIIFVTVSTDHVFDGYTYKAFSYILKPVDGNRLDEEIGRYMAERFKCTNCLHITVNNRKEQIFLDKVYYFEGEGRKIRIHQKDDDISFYAKMADLEEMLKQYGFVRCHQSYIVNKKYVTGCSRTEVKIGEEILPVSRKYQENVKDII